MNLTPILISLILTHSFTLAAVDDPAQQTAQPSTAASASTATASPETTVQARGESQPASATQQSPTSSAAQQHFSEAALAEQRLMELLPEYKTRWPEIILQRQRIAELKRQEDLKAAVSRLQELLPHYREQWPAIMSEVHKIDELQRQARQPKGVQFSTPVPLHGGKGSQAFQLQLNEVARAISIPDYEAAHAALQTARSMEPEHSMVNYYEILLNEREFLDAAAALEAKRRQQRDLWYPVNPKRRAEK